MILIMVPRLMYLLPLKTLDYRVKRAPFKILNDSLTLYYVCVANRSNSTILYSFQFQTSI